MNLNLTQLLEKKQTSVTVVVKKLDFFKSVTTGRSINGVHFHFYRTGADISKVPYIPNCRALIFGEFHLVEITQSSKVTRKHKPV